jgi:hypothetical protein
VIPLNWVVNTTTGKDMNFSNALIDELKKAKGLKTDTEVAELLPEMNKGNLSKIRKGTENRHLNETQAMFIAKECGINPEWVLVQLAEECAKSELAKKAWANIAKKISRSASAAVLALIIAFGGLVPDKDSKAVFV